MANVISPYYDITAAATAEDILLGSTRIRVIGKSA